MTTFVRAANARDLDAVGRLGELLVRLHHEFDARRYKAPTAGTARGYASFFASQLGNDGFVLLVAEEDGRVVGYAYASLEGPDYSALRGPAGVFHDLVVDPDHRGRGVGRLLLDAMLADLKARGVPRVVLSTAEQNEAAQRLVQRAGFRRTLIEMTRELDDDTR